MKLEINENEYLVLLLALKCLRYCEPLFSERQHGDGAKYQECVAVMEGFIEKVELQISSDLGITDKRETKTVFETLRSLDVNSPKAKQNKETN